MARVVKDRGASGHDSILFRQDMDYPREPGQITYYPPEASDELRKQVIKDKAGGITLYIIGFMLTFIGYALSTSVNQGFAVYEILIPVLLIFALIFALMFLYLNNIVLAKLSRTLPKILVAALFLLFIFSILQAVNNLQSLEAPDEPSQGASPAEWNNYNNTLNQIENDMRNAFQDLQNTIVNPGFFIMTAGLLITNGGGTMLWTSTKVVHQYIPGMIIIETPNAVAPAYAAPAYAAPVHQEAQEAQEAAEQHEQKLCQHCSQPLEYIEQYGRYYCYDCQEYGPKDL